jgi:hypothetical protein
MLSPLIFFSITLFSYRRLSRKPLLFKSFTGLTVAEFDSLCKDIDGMYKKYEIKRLSAKRRERKVGAGRPFKLCLQNRLLMLLVYYRMYITYTLTGFLFDIDQSNVCRDIQKIEPLVRQCLPIPQKLYRITKRLKTQDEVEQYFPGFRAFIDVTEQQIPRPKDKVRKTIYYSGKRKRHTVKKEIMVNEQGKILYKTCYKTGHRHDYNIYKTNRPTTPEDVENVFDLGFLGVEKDFSEQKSSLPFRKKRSKLLPIEEKEYNRIHAKARVVVEHTICRIKKFRIMCDIFRNRLNRYNRISDIVTGLVNYRIMTTG